MFEFKNLLELTKKFSTENKCVNFLKKVRWNNKPICVYCNHKSVCEVKDGDFKCSKCNNRFTIKTKTIFAGSKVSLRKWFMAIYLITNHKKGISSIQLSKDIGVTQKTAWFMLQRLKYITENNFNKDVFTNECEIDEAYLGGKEENRHMKDRVKGTKNKTIVIGIVNRKTKQVKSKVVESSKYQDLGQNVIDNIEMGSDIITDELTSYKLLNRFYNHNTINHSKGEYVKQDNKQSYKIHTNSIEGFWSLVKKTINGTHHWISKKHLDRYLSEMNFRYSNKDLSCNLIFDKFINNLQGRLKYKVLVA